VEEGDLLSQVVFNTVAAGVVRDDPASRVTLRKIVGQQKGGFVVAQAGDYQLRVDAAY